MYWANGGVSTVPTPKCLAKQTVAFIQWETVHYVSENILVFIGCFQPDPPGHFIAFPASPETLDVKSRSWMTAQSNTTVQPWYSW